VGRLKQFLARAETLPGVGLNMACYMGMLLIPFDNREVLQRALLNGCSHVPDTSDVELYHLVGFAHCGLQPTRSNGSKKQSSDKTSSPILEIARCMRY